MVLLPIVDAAPAIAQCRQCHLLARDRAEGVVAPREGVSGLHV